MIPKIRPDLTILDLLSVFGSSVTRHEFEEAVAARAGAKYGLSFAYAHSSFFAVLRALELTQAEIILPAYTCEIMPAVVVATGNIPVLVDIDLTDYNIDLDALRSKITSKTRVIVATHMFGYPTNLEAIREIANNEQIVIVEDAALTFPGSTVGSHGLQGDVGLFSFGPGKPLFTIRGGVVVTNSGALYERLSSYRDREMGYLPPKQYAKRWVLLMVHYLLSKVWIHNLTWRLHLSRDTVYSLVSRLRPMEGDYQFSTSSLPGDYATRYADFQARIGLSQLEKSDMILSRRRACADLYAKTLRGIPGLTPASIIEGASYALYAARVKDRDAIGFTEKMRARGIETGRTFSYALPTLEKYRSYVQGTFPEAVRASREVVNLPIYPGLTEEQVCYVAENIRQVLGSNQ